MVATLVRMAAPGLVAKAVKVILRVYGMVVTVAWGLFAWHVGQ